MSAPSIWHELYAMRQHSFDMLILFVTGRCNARCHHCFYWKNLGAGIADLSLESIRKISCSMPPFRTLLLSGGEPTLRTDLSELIDTFHANNQIQSVSVPTNGLQPDRVASMADQVATLSPKLSVSFNVSIDGLNETHDAIRGVPGSFESVMQTLRQLRQIADRHTNFRVLVNTVICADNDQQIVPLADYIKSTRLADGHFFEIVRGEPKELRLKSVPPARLQSIYRALTPIQQGYLVNEARRKKSGWLGMWRQVTDVGNLINKYRHQWAAYSCNRKWDFPCMAGEGIGVIDYDGRLRICELREQGVNLADYDYHFMRAWNSETIRREACIAKTHACDCTHTCFLNLSMRQSFSARLIKSPWMYLLYKIGRAC